MDLKKIGMFIASSRKVKNMTQKELADGIGVTDKAVSRWETGRGFPDVSLLTSLAETLGVSISEIVMGEKIEIVEKMTMEIMDKTVIGTLDYSQREISKSKRWKNIVIALLSGVVLVGLLSSAFRYLANAENVSGLLYVILLFFAVPIGVPVLINSLNFKHQSLALRKYLWIAPILVLVLAVLISWANNPYFFNGLFDGYQDGSRSRYYRIVFFIPCLTSAAATAVCYAVNRIRTNGKRV